MLNDMLKSANKKGSQIDSNIERLAFRVRRCKQRADRKMAKKHHFVVILPPQLISS